MKATTHSEVTIHSLIGRAGGEPIWWLAVIAIITAAGITLISLETEFLLRAQELNLWLPTGVYWKTLMQYPGGGVSWLGTYLTQYFYYPWLGVGILCTLWLAICGMMAYVFRLRGVKLLLTLLVPAALLACLTQTGYWIFYQKLQGHLFVPTVGVTIAMLVLVAQRLMDSIMRGNMAVCTRAAWIAIVCIGGYPLCGAWALAATGMLALYDMGTALRRDTNASGRAALSSRSEAMLLAVTAALLIAAVPQVYYQQVFEMTQRNLVYVAAMPSFRYGQDSYATYRLPYYAIIAAFTITLAVTFWPKRLALRMKPAVQAVLTGLLLVCAAVGVKSAWYRDINFTKELAMNRAIEELDWERVLRIARDGSSTVKPTRQMVLYKNLALFRMGRAGDEMFTYPEGAMQQNVPWRVHMTQVGGKLIYYHYGKENFCYRWCMEDGVEFGWKAETLKFMARTSLLNKEWVVAKKYLDLLAKTTFHRRWAARYAALLRTPEAFDLPALEASVQAGKPLMNDDAMKEFAPIMHLMTYPDRLDGDNTLVEMYLLQTFARGNGDDPLFQEMTLICALYMKDIPLFWPRFMKYASMHPDIHMPRHYQEAAYLYGHLEDKVDISHMPFDQSVRDSYERFMRFNTQCGPMTEEQKAVAFYPQFGDTFYYFYFLVRNQKTN